MTKKKDQEEQDDSDIKITHGEFAGKTVGEARAILAKRKKDSKNEDSEG